MVSCTILVLMREPPGAVDVKPVVFTGPTGPLLAHRVAAHLFLVPGHQGISCQYQGCIHYLFVPSHRECAGTQEGCTSFLFLITVTCHLLAHWRVACLPLAPADSASAGTQGACMGLLEGCVLFAVPPEAHRNQDVCSVVFSGITGPLSAQSDAAPISCVLYLAESAYAASQNAGTGLLLAPWP